MFDAASGSNIVNQVKRAYNGFGQLTREWQSHAGAVNTSTTPSVQYAYSEMSGGANHSRLVSMTYPDGRVLSCNSASGLDESISRLSSISDTTGTLEERVGGSTTTRYTRSPVYVDAPLKRERDTNSDGVLDERLWAVQDANWNVTALTDDGGAVVERYAYDPFGVATVYDASYNKCDGGSSHGWKHLHQGGKWDAQAGLSEFRNRVSSPTPERGWSRGRRVGSRPARALSEWPELTSRRAS
jgi:hypothetical protein